MLPVMSCRNAALLSFLITAGVLSAQSSKNILQRAFPTAPPDRQPLLGPLAPGFSLMVAGRGLDVQPSNEPSSARLTVPGIPLQLEVHYERRADIDLYRIRHAPGSEIRAEQVRFDWRFSEAYNESMTFDTGALQGQPLYLPDGKVPDNHFTNWGSLFYNRDTNVAVGAELDGAEPSRHARRGHSRFTKISTLQLMTTTGNPNMEITLFAYRPKDSRFWWVEWYQLCSLSDLDIPANLLL